MSKKNKQDNSFKMLQRRANLSNDELAELLDIDRSSVARYRAGGKVPRSIYIVLDNYSQLRYVLKDDYSKVNSLGIYSVSA